MTKDQPTALRLADLYTAETWPSGLSLNQWALSAAAELRRLHAENKVLRSAVTRLHKAKGRYHTQNALCALFDAFGLSNTKPERKMK